MGGNKAKAMFKRASKTGGTLVAVIGDEDTVTGMLLAGVGNVDKSTREHKRNYFVCDSKTPVNEIEEAFTRLTSDGDITVLIITQTVASTIRHVLDSYDEMLPAIIEVPTKSAPYDPEGDVVMHKIRRKMGMEA